MRSLWQTVTRRLGRALTRDIALVCLADGIVGVSFGAITVAAGLPLWLPMMLSVVVFAGASQFMFVAIVAAGGSPIAAMIAGLLVNARHLPFGLAIGDALGSGLLRRLVGSQLMIDESTAFALAQRDPRRRRAAYWACGGALFVCWNLGVVAGALGGSVIHDTDTFGLDAAFPAVLLALMVPSLKVRAVRLAAVVGAVVAVTLSPLLPAGLPVLLSLAALPLALIGRFRPEPHRPERHGPERHRPEQAVEMADPVDAGTSRGGDAGPRTRERHDHRRRGAASAGDEAIGAAR